MLLTLFVWLLGLLSAAGVGYTILAACLTARMGRATARLGSAEPATLLKPLHGAEPRLVANLSSFLDQDWDAPIQMVAGVQRPDDPAIDAVRTLQADTTGAEITLVQNGARHGSNGKVSNLVNMLPAARHELIVLSDSDMAASPTYLRVLAGALAQPGVGAVTCAYRGRGDAGFWSEVAAAGISYHFVPQLLVGLATGMARPGMGSTIALRRATLDRIGGFLPFADTLADDYAVGEAVRGLGLAVTVPPMLLVHGCTERSLTDVWRHEQRWAATILRINPGGQIGTIVTYPVPIALALLPLSPSTGAALLLVGLAARWALQWAVDRVAGARSAPAWLLPLRDCLSFAVFVSAFFTRRVDWRGARLHMARDGRMTAEPETRP